MYGWINYLDIFFDVEMVCEYVEVFLVLLLCDVGCFLFFWVGEIWKFL